MSAPLENTVGNRIYILHDVDALELEKPLKATHHETDDRIGVQLLALNPALASTCPI